MNLNIENRYSEYKNSDIVWLGDIPKHWTVKRLKDFSIIKGRIGFKGYTKNDFVESKKDGALVIGATEMDSNGFLNVKNPQYISWFKYYESPEIMLKPDFLLLVQRGSTVGKVALVDKSIEIATINPSLVILKNIKAEVRFVLYFLMSASIQGFIKSQTSLTAIPMISQEQIGKYEISLPNYDEQISISKYLDKKTSAIDRKVSLLEYKCTCYKELSRSLINEAVCKGLNKNVPLKDSGIEWIGKIPKHWQVERFKNFARTIKGKSTELLDEPLEGSLINLSLDYLRNDTTTFVSYSLCSDKSQKVNERDYIIIWDGAGVGEILRGKKGALSSTTAKLKFNQKRMLPNYFYFLRHNLEYTLKSIPTGMGIPHLNPNVLNNYFCPVPPLDEQTAIAEHLDKKTTTIDAIVANIKLQIDNLKELRKTLINDVVTGKLKVTEDEKG